MLFELYLRRKIQQKQFPFLKIMPDFQFCYQQFRFLSNIEGDRLSELGLGLTSIILFNTCRQGEVSNMKN